MSHHSIRQETSFVRVLPRLIIFAIGLIAYFLPVSEALGQPSPPQQPTPSASAPDSLSAKQRREVSDLIQAQSSNAIRTLIEAERDHVKEVVDSVNENTKTLVGMMQSLVVIMATIILGAGGYQIFQAVKARQELNTLREKIKEIETKLKMEFKEQAKEARKEFEEQAKEARKEFSDLANSQRHAYLLTGRISDLEEPSIIHPLKRRDRDLIEGYLKQIDDLCQKSKEDPWGLLTQFDCELIANAHHYLATSEDSTLKYTEKQSHEEKAIGYYKKALEWIDRDSLSMPYEPVTLWNCTIKRRLANAYASSGQAAEAVKLYRQLCEAKPHAVWASDWAAAELSWADLLRLSEDFQEARNHYLGAIDAIEKEYNTGSDEPKLTGVPERRYLVESLLGLANTLTALGKYDDAIKYYTQAAKNAEHWQMPIRKWTYSSWGDAQRKAGHYDDCLISYEKELINYPDNIEARYRKGQGHFAAYCYLYSHGDKVGAMRQLENAEQDLRVAITDVKWDNRPPVALAYYAFILKKLGKVPDVEAEEHLEKALESQRKRLDESRSKEGRTTAQVLYDLAVCYAMKGSSSSPEAHKYLKKAIDSIPAAAFWANESHCADFFGLHEGDPQRLDDFLHEVELHSSQPA
jgi:tetratricopeptide (TPR) repeat protein